MQPLIYYASEAVMGNPNAEYMLGCHYSAGEDVLPNMREASLWWLKAANKGHMDAQYTLGAIYLSCTECENYLEVSHQWLTLAAKNGSEKAKYLLPEVEKRMLLDKKNIH